MIMVIICVFNIKNPLCKSSYKKIPQCKTLCGNC